jgi:hypothetical protein
MYKDKKEIVRNFNELELTEFGDFRTDDDRERNNIFSNNAKLLLNF